MNSTAASPHPPAPWLRFTLAPADALATVLADPHTLAAIGYADGAVATADDDPRQLRVPLQAHGQAPLEVWRSTRTVRHGRDDGIAWAEDGALLFGAIEVDEAGGDAIETAAAEAYARLLPHLRARGYPHLLRVWNYLDAITAGNGDGERYRRFCVGRVRGLGTIDTATLPAATAIGRVDGVRRLQLYWLAAREAGTPLENPRQVSAWRYPRAYGPQSPSFARAMLPPAHGGLPLLLSGTAAIVGHASRHHDSLTDQLDETLANLDSLIAAARQRRPDLAPALGRDSLLKVYVRDHADLAAVAAALAARLPPAVPRLLLHGHVCRRELRVEIEGVHG